MKKVKIIFLLTAVTILTGCFFKITPRDTVEELLSKYIQNDKEIVKQLDEYLNKQNLTEEQKERYKNIFKDEYATIKYNIKDETIDGNGATVEVEIEVKNLYKTEKEAENYMLLYPKKFYTNNEYDENKFIDYKLSKLEDTSSSIIYTIYINLFLEENVWKIEQLDETTLKKLHGIYDYEQLN